MSLDRIKDSAAIREGAAIGAVASRSAIALAGADRASYLQGLLTNDIQALQPGQGCYSAWLTPQGRMFTDMHVLQSDSLLLLDVPANLAEEVLQRLDQFLFTEDVQLQSLADSLTSVWLHGPRAAHVLEQSLGATSLDAWAQYQHERRDFDGTAVVIARIDQLGVPGYCAYVEAGQHDALVTTLERSGAALVSADAIDAARIEHGYPVFGLDMTHDTIPLEAGIENRAISFTKGCYVGQEIIIRVLHRGGGRLARRLVGLRAPDGALRRDAKIMSGEREIGLVTSAAESAQLGSIALGYVHRDFVAPSTHVVVDVDGHRLDAIVTALPFSNQLS